MPNAAPKKKTARTGETARPRLVAVEDDEDFQFILRQWLTPHFDLVLLPHGEELFDEVESLRPELVMLDLQLPGPDGLLLCHRLRRHPAMKDAPILILTGRQDTDAFLGSIEVGATSFLLKPVTKADLLGRLKELAEGA